MIEKTIGGTFCYACNTCGEVLDTGELSFHEAINRMKEAGWAAYKPGSEWQHTCPGCKKEWVREKQREEWK